MIWAAHMDADGQVNCEEFMHLLVSSEAALPCTWLPGVSHLCYPHPSGHFSGWLTNPDFLPHFLSSLLPTSHPLLTQDDPDHCQDQQSSNAQCLRSRCSKGALGRDQEGRQSAPCPREGPPQYP